MNFNHNSLRAREARLGKTLGNKFLFAIMLILTIAFLAGGICLIAFGYAVGWLCLSAMILMVMILYWTKKELVPVPIGKNENDINDLLSNDVLAKMPKNPSAQVLANVVMQTTSGRFMYVRYDISPQLLNDIASQLPAEPGPIFETALKIRSGTGSKEIHGAILTAAIVANHPESEAILKRMKLDMRDLLDGVIWFNHLSSMVEEFKKRRHDGGIGRDLSFGYIPILQRFGQNISGGHANSTRIQLSAHREILMQMLEIFSKGGKQNVALIGPEGSGRTTIVNAFAEMLMDADANIPKNLQYRQIFKLDAAALISGAGERGQLEGLVNHVLGEAYAAKNIIIWLENAQLFFEEGVGSVDISNVLLPILEAGNLRIILTMDRQKFLEISARKAALANTLNKIMVKPANEEETMKVLQDQTPLLEFQHKCSYTIWALKEAYRLSEKYVYDMEMPGKALTLLDTAGGYADPATHLVTAASVQEAVEKTAGVKIFSQEKTSDSDKQQLLNLEELIHQRMIDQEVAVKTVSDALRRAAAGVRNEGKPIGTFLFLGPTGVGKTELAKALSEVYFNGEKNIVRLDMNEFVTPGDVSRLIADGAEDELSLTAQIMKQPFAVVLLDELEKAHPQVLTTLLQMLDEGILRDVKGREVSFRDTIVIATSNAGAEMIRQMTATGGADFAAMKDQILDALLV